MFIKVLIKWNINASDSSSQELYDHIRQTQKQKSYLDSIPICLFDKSASQSERNAKSSSEITLKHFTRTRKKKFPKFWKTKNIRKRKKFRNFNTKILKLKKKIPTSYRSLVGTIETEPRSNGHTNHDRSKAFHVKPSIAFITEKKLIVSFSRTTFLAGDITVAIFVFLLFLFNHRERFRHYLSHWFHLPRRWRFGGRASRWSSRSSPRWARRRRGGGSVPRSHGVGSRRRVAGERERWFWLVEANVHRVCARKVMCASPGV